jgi:hypothetical protein
MIFFVGIAEWTRGEHQRRLELWSNLTETGAAEGLAPSTIRGLRIYAGQAGIFFDGDGTWNTGGPGRVALTLKLTDKTYADNATDDQLDYHYPSTRRPPSFDRNEIASVKRAQGLGLPLFVTSPNRLRKSRTDVRLGYVDSYNDDEAMFFVTFVDSILPLATPDELPTTDDDAALFGGLPEQTLRLVQQRTQQRRFKIDVLNRYGEKCALCDITTPRLIQGAHLIPKSISGADDALNGLPLCLNHHTAFDAFLLRIAPDGSGITYAPGVSKSLLQVTHDDLTHLPAKPSAKALSRFYRTDAARAAFATWA